MRKSTAFAGASACSRLRAGEGRKLLDAVVFPALARSKDYDDKVAALMQQKSYGDDMNSLIKNELLPLVPARYSSAVKAFVSLQQASLESARRDTLDTVTHVRFVVVTLMGAGLAAAVCAAMLVSRSIISPFEAARLGARNASPRGDLTADF